MSQSYYPLWKKGTTSNIEFADTRKLFNLEPRTMDLFGSTMVDRATAEDDTYHYTIYKTRFGYSVGRRPKNNGSSENKTYLVADTDEFEIIKGLDRAVKELANQVSVLMALRLEAKQ